MKKIVLFIALITGSIAMQAQTQTQSELEKIQEKMEAHLKEMLQDFSLPFDTAQSSIIKIDTFFFKSFGDLDAEGNFAPNQEMDDFMRQMEQMFQQHFGSFDLQPFGNQNDQPAIPGPDLLKDQPKRKKTTPKRKTYRL